MDSIKPSYSMVGSRQWRSLLLYLIAVILVFIVAGCGEAPTGSSTQTTGQFSATSTTGSKPEPSASTNLIPSPSQPPVTSPETAAGSQLIEPRNAIRRAER